MFSHYIIPYFEVSISYMIVATRNYASLLHNVQFRVIILFLHYVLYQGSAVLSCVLLLCLIFLLLKCYVIVAL